MAGDCRGREAIRIRRVGARTAVHAVQFNGKQEPEPFGPRSACAAPATVKQTEPSPVPLSSSATGRPETGAWEGDEGGLSARIPANEETVRAPPGVHAVMTPTRPAGKPDRVLFSSSFS